MLCKIQIFYYFLWAFLKPPLASFILYQVYLSLLLASIAVAIRTCRHNISCYPKNMPMQENNYRFRVMCLFFVQKILNNKFKIYFWGLIICLLTHTLIAVTCMIRKPENAIEVCWRIRIFLLLIIPGRWFCCLFLSTIIPGVHGFSCSVWRT